MTTREHIQIALQAALRKVPSHYKLTLPLTRMLLAELAEGRPWIGQYLDTHAESTFERIARAALREIELERRYL